MKSCVLLILFLLFHYSSTLKLKFDPNDLKITMAPENLSKLFESFLKTDNLHLAALLLKTEASDFTSAYCRIWRTAQNSELIYEIWDDNFDGKIDRDQLNYLITPMCIAESYFTLINLSEAMIDMLPAQSLLQISTFPVQLLNIKFVEYVLERAVMDRPHDPRTKWTTWVINDDSRHASNSPFYYKYGWQLVNPSSFLQLSDKRVESLIKWVMLPSDQAFAKISDTEALIRTLTLLSWESPKCATALKDIDERLFGRFLGKTTVLSLKIYRLGGSSFPLELLKLIEILNEYVEDPSNILIGDWFIGILNIWRCGLMGLRPSPRGTEIFKVIIDFSMFKLDPTFQGITKLLELFDSSFHPLIEEAVFEKFNDPEYKFIKLFYRETPAFFQNSFSRIPFNLRLTSFLRHKRNKTPNSTSYAIENEKIDMKLFWEIGGPTEFLLFVADKFRNGVVDLTKFSLDPLIGIRYVGHQLSFKNLIKLFLISVKEMAEWFKTVDSEGHVILLPHCSRLMWELIGYFLIQARILDIPHALNFEKEFFIEMMKTSVPIEYLQKVSASFKKCKLNDIRLLSLHVMENFSVASVIQMEEYAEAKDKLIDCKSLAFRLYKKGMRSMQNGMNHVLEPFKFSEEEVYRIFYQ